MDIKLCEETVPGRPCSCRRNWPPAPTVRLIFIDFTRPTVLTNFYFSCAGWKLRWFTKKKVNMLLRIDLCTLPAADKAISQHDRIRCASWCRRKKQRAIKDYCCCASEDDRCLIFSSSSNNTHYHYKLRQWFHTNTSTNILICVLHTNTNTVLLWVQ